MPEKLTEEVKNLIQSAKDSHNLIEMVNTNGWKFIKEFYFDQKLLECKASLANPKNIDMFTIQADRLMIDFIETLLDEIETQVKIGLEDEEELVKRKEKKKK